MKLHYKNRYIAILVALLGVSGSVSALNTAEITASTASPDCFEYRVVGMCYWLFCTPYSCKVRTSVKVRHYIPDAVVTSYTATGDSPWSETAAIGSPISGVAEGGGDGVTSQANENDLAKFKNVDVIGHPGAFALNFTNGSGYTCEGAGTPFMPYFISTLDSVGWRYNLPEMVYPESLVPGMREIRSRTSMDLWGNVYPRGGFTHQTDDYKAAATAAQRAGDIVTRRGQPHIYMPLLASQKQGYWPASALKEADASTGKWQELTPTRSNSCQVFPDGKITHKQANDGAYAWALWRPYSCCKQRGQTFLGSVNFN